MKPLFQALSAVLCFGAIRGKKKRLPMPPLAAAVLLALFWGALAACKAEEETGPAIEMLVQFYDTNQNYVEVPALTPPEGESEDAQAIRAINQELEELARYYRSVLELGGETLESTWCLCYPSETDRYVNLVLFQKDGFAAVNSDGGSIRTWCYDKEDKSPMELREALEQAGLTREQLLADLEQFVRAEQSGESGQSFDAEIQGFRMGEDGDAVFYLAVDLGTNRPLAGPNQLYLWEDGVFCPYDVTDAGGGAVPLVPAEEALDLEPPLWRQWYFAGEEPEGGFTKPPQDPPEEVLVRTALEDYLFLGEYGQAPQLTVLLDQPLGSQNLMVVRVEGYPHVGGLDNLVWGVWDRSTRSVVGEVYALRGDESAVSYWTQGEETCLLLTNNTVNHGYESSQGLYYFRFGPQGLEPISQLPQSARPAGVEVPEDEIFLAQHGEIPREIETARAGYWQDHLVQPNGQGVDLFTRTEGWDEAFPRGDCPQWSFAGHLPFGTDAED